MARPLMGRLVSSAMPYQRHELPRPAQPGRPGRTWTEAVRPRGPFTYDKPMAVLVGRWTGSMGEGVAIGLDGMRRATVFGSPMAGLRGAIETLTLEHSKIPVRIPAERLYHIDGTPREAFVPPFPIEAGPGDAVLDAAVRRLLESRRVADGAGVAQAGEPLFRQAEFRSEQLVRVLAEPGRVAHVHVRLR